MTDGVGAQAPHGLLLAFYGDDFTGSTDAMQAMAASGVPTVLFLQTPTPEMMARFPDVRCVGLAGSSRGRSPEWMDAELPGAFATLAGLGAPILQYKVCSTFDSSPQIGSIGRAIDIGVRAMGGDWSPMVVGAPRLKRYQAFGNLFAAVDGVAYRIDRHPTMSRHPVTPMAEGDLREHLAKQTSRRIELIDLVQVRSEAEARRRAVAGDDTPVVMIDVVDAETQLAAGRLAWEQRQSGVFSASSSGLNYALTAYWRSLGMLPDQASLPPAGPASLIAAVSGSCSPVTAGQLAWARENGFVLERLRIDDALGPAQEAEIERVVAVAAAAVDAGKSPIVFSAEGPDDPAVLGFDQAAAGAGLQRGEAARRVGATLGRIMRRLLEGRRVQRLVIAGGDSSGEVMSGLGAYALTVLADCVPGGPLCRAWADDPRFGGLEVVLKGGQIGGRDLFGAVLSGGA